MCQLLCLVLNWFKHSGGEAGAVWDAPDRTPAVVSR